MAYSFHITRGQSEDIVDSDGVLCSLELKIHEQLFKALDRHASKYLHLSTFRNHYEDGFVGHESLEHLIAEIELATSHFERRSPFKPFFENLHVLCVLALSRDGSISAFCD